jgi:cysteine desulfurase/selenocysteine lyase
MEIPTKEIDSRSATAGQPPLDVQTVRDQFPILGREVHGRPLVYLDNAASSQRPQRVIERVGRYYREEHANVHRAVHALSAASTEAYEGARSRVAHHIGASEAAEIVFTRGTTEAINLVASSWGGDVLGEGDEVVLTKMEHHSNIVPWQLAAERTGATLRFADVTPTGLLDLDDLRSLVGPQTRLIGVTHVSNSLGTVNPIPEIAEIARDAGALLLVDGAQATPHLAVNVQSLDCDFYAFSGHKMCGPTGIGVLWARRELLERMPPFQGGGEMISEVRLDGSEWAAVPHKFEAGTPNIAGAIGLAEAVDFLDEVGIEAIQTHEEKLTEYVLERLPVIPHLTLYGLRNAGPDRLSVFSFTYGDVHPHDLATILDQQGVAIRAGHHCNQPLMDHYGIDATARASFYLYNTTDEADALIDGLALAAELFGLPASAEG